MFWALAESNGSLTPIQKFLLAFAVIFLLALVLTTKKPK